MSKLIGFSTAGGKSVEISANAMAKAESLFDDLDVAMDPKLSGFGTVGFNTAAGKIVQIGAEAMAKAESIFDDLNAATDSKSIGFTTANGKNLQIGAEAMAKAESIFNGLDDAPDPKFSAFETVGFNTAAGKNVQIGAEALAKAESIFNGLDDAPDPKISGFATVGFNTAAGKNLKISDDAIAKAKTLFGDLENGDNSNGFGLGAATNFTTPSAPVVAKKMTNFDTTPKLPEGSKLPLGRRRLADSAPATMASEKKKRRLDIFSRFDATDDKKSASQPTSSTAVLETFGKSGVTFQYISQSNKKRTPLPILFTTPKFVPPSVESVSSDIDKPSIAIQNADDDTFTSFGAIDDVEDSEPRKIEVGLLYRQRTDGISCRTTLSSELAGQTPRSYDREEYERYGVKKRTLEIKAQNARSFAFNDDYFAVKGESQVRLGDGVLVKLDDLGVIPADTFVTAFTESGIVDSKLISLDWCLNHYRWIVWKEAAMEVGFPHIFGGKLLTPDRVMYQLKYRYDREVEKADRSCLKRILNCDDTTYRPMVLCVSDVLMNQNVDAMIEVTDGWYSVKARLDIPLSQRLSRGQISIGQKLFISRCSIVGIEGGCEPLEASASVQLVLTANSVRRAHWNTKLGFLRLKKLPCFSLASLVAGGGMTAGVEVIIERIFPLQYMVKSSTGHTLVMDEKTESKDAQTFQQHYDRCWEKLVAEVEKELLSDDAVHEGVVKLRPRKDRYVSIPKASEIRRICDTEELYNIFKNAADPDAVTDSATATQKERLKAFCEKINEQQQNDIRHRFEKAIEEKAACLPQRKVTPFLKMQLAGRHPTDIQRKVSFILTIWRPDEDMIYHVNEGSAYLITNLQVSQSKTNGTKSGNLDLSTTNDTRFIPLEKKNHSVTMGK